MTDMKARARRARGGLKKQNAGPGAFAVGPDDAERLPSTNRANIELAKANSRLGGPVHEETDNDSNFAQKTGPTDRLKEAPDSTRDDETVDRRKPMVAARVRLADVSKMNVLAMEPEGHFQRMKEQGDEAQAPKSNLKTTVQSTTKQDKSSNRDQSLASMKAKARRQRSGGQKQKFQHLTPAARPSRAKSEGSQPITTTEDLKARARKQHRGWKKQGLRPGAVAVGSSTAENVAEQDHSAGVDGHLTNSTIGGFQGDPQQFQDLRPASVATVRAVSDGSRSTERSGDAKARARRERQAAGLESVRPGAVAVEGTEEPSESDTDQRGATSKTKPGFLPPSVAASQARHRDRKMREKAAALTQGGGQSTATQSTEELEDNKASNDDDAASQTDTIQEELATYDELDDFKLAKKASINAMPASTARWPSDDSARSKAGSLRSFWVSRSGRSDGRRGSSNTFGRGGGSGGFLVEATLVTDHGIDVENTGRDVAPAATVVVAEQVKKSWYSNRKVQCVFVILLLGAIGVIVWWALSRPSPAPELVLVSSSPSVSMYPSMSPTTGVPSSIPSLNPTGRQIKTVTVEIRFDRFPNEIGWRLEDACGILEEVQPGIYSGPQYIEAVQRIKFDLNVGITYTFTVLDSFGDGLCCSDGSVTLTLDEDGSNLFKVSGNFGSIRSEDFVIPGVAAAPLTCSPTATPTFSPTSPPTGTERPSQSLSPSTSPTSTTELFQSIETRGRCLEIPNNDVRNGVELRLANCTYEFNQLWNAEDYQIVSAANKSMCIDSKDTATELGSPLQIFECLPGFPPQNFSLFERFDGLWFVNFRSPSPFCATADTTNATNATNTTTTVIDDRVFLADCFEAPVSAWTQNYVPDPFAPSASPTQTSGPTTTPTTLEMAFKTFESVGGFCVTVEANMIRNSDVVTLRECNGQLNQMWYIDGEGRVRSPLSSIYCWSANMDFPLLLSFCHGGPSERFVVDDESGQIQMEVDNSTCLSAMEGLTPNNEMDFLLFVEPCEDNATKQVFTSTFYSELSRWPSQAPSISGRPSISSPPSLPPAAIKTRSVELRINLDDYPKQVGWGLAGPCGMIAEASPGHYNNLLRRSQVVEGFELDVGHTYTFVLVDSAGDGLCCPLGRVTLVLDLGGGESRYLLGEADDFGETVSKTFTVPGLATAMKCSST